MKSNARTKILNFVTWFLTLILVLASSSNFLVFNQITIAAIELVAIGVLLYSNYLAQVKLKPEISSWIVSIVLGVILYSAIVNGKGDRGAYSLILFFPLVIYPLLGLKKGTYLYLSFGSLVWLTTLYGTQYWSYQNPYAYLINITITLLVGGMVIYYTEQAMRDMLETLHTASITDPLTGLWNRKMSDDMLEHFYAESKRYKKSYSIILLDIDFFKKINDQYGHNVGDQMLVEFSDVILNSFREPDMVFRWGGEEFLIILPNTTLDEAETAAKKIIKEARNHTFNSSAKHMTISAGVAAYSGDSDKDTFFKEADNALYQAKDQGRDRYILAH